MFKKLFFVFFLIGCGIFAWLLTSADSRFEVAYSQRLAQPADKIWQLLEDVENWPQWWPGFETVKLLGPRQAGSQLELKLEGVLEAAPAVLTEFQPNQRLAWQQQGFFGSVATSRLVLVAQANGTEVTFGHQIEGPQAKLAEFGNHEEFIQYQKLFLKALELQLQPLAGEKD